MRRIKFGGLIYIARSVHLGRRRKRCDDSRGSRLDPASARRRKSVRQDTSRHSANPATGEPPKNFRKVNAFGRIVKTAATRRNGLSRPIPASTGRCVPGAGRPTRRARGPADGASPRRKATRRSGPTARKRAPAVLLDADIDKGAESGDVRHDTRQYHALAQAVDRMHVGELENPGLAARIESGRASSERMSLSVGSPVRSVT